MRCTCKLTTVSYANIETSIYRFTVKFSDPTTIIFVGKQIDTIGTYHVAGNSRYDDDDDDDDGTGCNEYKKYSHIVVENDDVR
jgi:hypothetical protein